jgi:hypothetical protein
VTIFEPPFHGKLLEEKEKMVQMIDEAVKGLQEMNH